MSEAAACCKLPPAYNHSVTLEWPKRLAHPVRVLMRAGNLNGRFECDVPCEYTTSASAHGGDVDVVVGEQSPPQVPKEISSKNPEVLTAARSMESAAIYTALRTLHRHVGAAMTTTLNTSAVPVTYLARSSIAKWGVAPQVFDALAPLELRGAHRAPQEGDRAAARVGQRPQWQGPQG
mgnify:CR=1 FL=1